MWHVVKPLLQITALLAGLLAFYLAAFAYEKGRARMGNRLEDWWIELRYDQRFAESPGSAFIQALFAFVEIRSIGFIGATFWSERVIPYASFSLVTSVWIWLALMVPLRVGIGWSNPLILLRIAADKELQWIIPTAIFLYPMAFVVPPMLTGVLSNFSREGLADLFSVRNYLPSSSVKFELKSLVAYCHFSIVLFVTFLVFVCSLAAVPVFIALLGGLAFFSLLLVAPGTFALSWVWIVLVPCAGIASAVLFLAATHYIVRKCWLGPLSFRKAMLALLSMLLLASFLFLGPLWFVSDGWTLSTPEHAQIATQNTPSSIARYLAYCNGLNVIVAYGFLVATVLLLAHTLVWPRLRRAIIAMRLAGIGFSRSVLCGFGIGFFLLATGRFGDWLDAFVSNPQIFEDIENLFKVLVLAERGVMRGVIGVGGGLLRTGFKNMFRHVAGSASI
jgi:hypothetical protein